MTGELAYKKHIHKFIFVHVTQTKIHLLNNTYFT